MEKLGRVRRAPSWAMEELEGKEYTEVPQVTPNRRNIPAEYPLGTL